MRFRFALLQITWDKPEPEPPYVDPRSTTALNTELAEPRRIGFSGDDLPDHDARKR